MAIGTSDIVTDDSRVDSSGATTAKEKGLVQIVWRDILQTSDWTPHKDVTCPTFCSIGWLISRDGKEIKIGNTLVVSSADDPPGTPYAVTSFPTGCVENIIFLEKKEQ